MRLAGYRRCTSEAQYAYGKMGDAPRIRITTMMRRRGRPAAGRRRRSEDVGILSPCHQHEMGTSSGGGACLTGCVPSTGWVNQSTWVHQPLPAPPSEPPINRLRPSHQRCLLLCNTLHRNNTACHVAFRHACLPHNLALSKQTQTQTQDTRIPNVRLHTATTSQPASIPLLHLPLHDSPPTL